MCTVSYIPTADGFFLTSNRDEKKTRSNAIHPTVYHKGDFKIIYPKDPDGKGTWIAINTKGVAVVLLNGAFVKHESKSFYQKSRGLVLLEVINAHNPKDEIAKMVLEGIEPFTLIICNFRSLTEFRWDGVLKHLKNLDPKKASIWSSSTLYDEQAVLKRTGWFENWQSLKPFPLEKEIVDFHHFEGEDCFEGLVVNRENVKTVSVTCVALKDEKISMTYNDLQNETIYKIAEGLH